MSWKLEYSECCRSWLSFLITWQEPLLSTRIPVKFSCRSAARLDL
jgi:hypothetical protein